MNTNNTRYTGVAISIHWIMAIGLLGTFAFGLYVHELPLSPSKLKYLSWHKWAGITLFLLVFFRLFWRLTHRPPAPPAHMPRSHVLIAEGVHHLLYLLMFLAPLSGWLYSSAKGFPTVWFGIVQLPDLVDKNKELADILHEVHEMLTFGMVALVGAHALAAIKHHVIDKDDVLARMLPFLKR